MEEHFCFQLSTFETRYKTFEVSRLAISAHYTLEMTLKHISNPTVSLIMSTQAFLFSRKKPSCEPHPEWSRNVRYKLKHSDLPHSDVCCILKRTSVCVDQSLIVQRRTDCYQRTQMYAASSNELQCALIKA